MSQPIRLSLLAITLLAVGFATGQPAAAQINRPSLHFTAAAGYQMAVRGNHWHRREPIRVIVHSGPWSVAVALDATKKGFFKIGINNVNRCAGISVDSYGTGSRHVSLVAPLLGCASPANPPQPQLTVLKGTRINSADALKIEGLSQIGSGQLALHVGQTLYVWMPGGGAAAMSPHVDAAYLVLVAQGTTPARACAQVDCGAGFFWRYLAVRAGHTVITFSAACRQVKPPCMLPDRAIEIDILP